MVERIVESAGGTVIKFMSDSGLLVIPGDHADLAIESLVQLKNETTSWLSRRGYLSRHIIKATFGFVVFGYVGSNSYKRVDIFGKAVNDTALLASSAMTVSATLRSKLHPNTLCLLDYPG